MNLIQTFVQQGIRENPETAAREVPQIMETYAIDNAKLNRVKDAAKRVLIQPDKFNLDNLRRAIAQAEGMIE